MTTKQTHSHAHTHAHSHVHGVIPPGTSLDRIFIICIVLNALFVAVEAGAGFYFHSLGLLSDAGHNLSDVFSLLLALLAIRLSQVPANDRYTYGYKKSTVLVSLLNAIILLVAVGAIAVESIRKFSHPAPVDGAAVSWTAGIGIVINGLTAWLLMSRQKNDLNVRGAYLHMAADTLVSVGVLVSGIVIVYTGAVWIDPAVSLLIAVIILISTWHLLAGSLRLSLDGVPETIRLDEVKRALTGNRYVAGLHHLHVWALSTTENALTAHIVLSDMAEMEPAKNEIKAQLRSLGIVHATLEFESAAAHCADEGCN